MSKIYEALQNAHRESMLPDKLSPRSPRNTRWHIAPRIETEQRMIGFYQRVEALLPNANMKVIQFVGSRQGEGTSTVVRQFAGVSALKMRKSVLVLDADGISPIQHVLFNARPEHSLNEAISDGGPMERAFCQVAYPGLSLCLVSGNAVSPAQVLNCSGLWEALRARFDLIVLDSPPVDVSSDGLALVRKADGVILVIEAERTRWPVVQNLRDSIIEYGGNFLGVVLNKRRYYIPGWVYKWL